MPSNKLISIIVNCFNGEKYLRDALDSIISQTYQDWELIFWDNKSTDLSAKIFQSYNDKRFNYFLSKSHTSLNEARTKALDKINGEFFCFFKLRKIACELLKTLFSSVSEQVTCRPLFFRPKETGNVCCEPRAGTRLILGTTVEKPVQRFACF